MLATGIMTRASQTRCNAAKAKAGLTLCCGSNRGWAATHPRVWLSCMGCGVGQGRERRGLQRCLPYSSSDGFSGKLLQCNEQISCPADSIRTLCQGKNESWSSLTLQPGAAGGVCCRLGTAASPRAAPQQDVSGVEEKSPAQKLREAGGAQVI